MQLYIIRHGQSTNNLLYATTGAEVGRVYDPALTELGVRQAERLAEFLARADDNLATDRFDTQNRAGFRLTHLYSSLMLRAVSTGAVLASRLGLPLHAWVDWHEEGGLFLEDPAGGGRVGKGGYGRAWFAEHYPALILPEAMGDEGWWNRPFEEGPSRTERAQRVLAELLARHGNSHDRVAVVSHGGFYNHFLAAVYGLSARLPIGHLMNNCALSRFTFQFGGARDGEAFVVYQNRADFLPADMVTY